MIFITSSELNPLFPFQYKITNTTDIIKTTCLSIGFLYSILSAWLCSSMQAGINLCVCASQRKMTENFRNSVIILSRTLQRAKVLVWKFVYALSSKYVGCSTDRHALGDGRLWISPKSSLGHDTFICIKLDGRTCALFLPLDIRDVRWG